MRTSRVAVFSSPWSVTVQETEMRPLRAGEALVQMEACALCTMEKQIFTGDLPIYPAVPGHEVAGIVVALGPGVDADEDLLGQRVAVDLLTRCGICRSCKLGRSCVCQAPQGEQLPAGLIGMGAGLGDHFICNVAGCYPIPIDMDAQLAALVEPLACVIQSVRRSGFREGDSCAVSGAGFMGRLHQVVLQAYAASSVDCVEPNTERARLFTHQGGHCLDAAIEADGSYDRVFMTFLAEGALDRALQLVADGGAVVLFGGRDGLASWTIDPYVLHRRAIDVIGSYSQEPQDWLDAVRLIGTASVHAALLRLISGDFVLDEIQAALRAALETASFRILVTP